MTIRYLFIISTLLFLSAASRSERQLPRPGKDFALFFAVNDYSDNADFSPLRNPVRDAEALAKELREMYGFASQDVELYRNPTKKEIFAVLERWQKKTFPPDAQLFVFFSGHGTFREFNKKGYFVPNGKAGSDYEGYIDLTDLSNIVTQIPCAHILLAIDACYSGTIDEEIAFKDSPSFRRPDDNPLAQRDNLIARQLRNTTRLRITSGGKERTPDGTDHSPFAKAMLDGLRAAYAHGDGLFTFPDLLARAERVSPTPRYGAMPGHEQGGFVFVAQQAAPPALAPTPEVPSHMAFIPGGTFDMGCTSEQKDCDDNESPATRVSLNNFYLGRYEVTVREFQQFINATGFKTNADKDGGSNIWISGYEPTWKKKSGVNWKCDADGNIRPASDYNHPVIHVSWYDAIAYCNWRSEKEGLTKVYTISRRIVTANWNANGYRLPTEAEWEYAARGGGKAVLFGNGKDIADPREINFDASASYKKPYSVAGEYRGKTVPVGSLNSPNALGVHDMSGNVWEWCWDRKAAYPRSERNNYRGPDSGPYRIYRGGSWGDSPQLVRVTYRGYGTPVNRDYDLGFRLARSVK